MSKVEEIHIRMTTGELETLRELASYMHKLGKISSNNMSEAVRLCLRFTVNEILKGIERERYGG